MPNILSMLKNLKISINNKNSYAKIEVDKLDETSGLKTRNGLW